MHFRSITTALVVCVSAANVQAADAVKVSTATKAPPKSISADIAKVLAKSAIAVEANQKPMLQLWVRETVPIHSDAEPAPYSSIEEGTLIGVIEIQAGTKMTDFRDQALNAGVYTLRLGIQPQDGNHMGVAPSPEFLCLSRVADDLKLEPLGHAALMKQSAKASGTGHPAVLFLQPFFEKPKLEFPAVNTNPANHTILNVKTGATAKGDKKIDLPIGIVIVGKTDAA